MDVVITKSKKADKNTMPVLMGLKLLALARKALVTTQHTVIKFVKTGI